MRNAFPDARIYAHERAIKRLSGGEAEQWLDILVSAMGDAIKGTQVVVPDTALKGDETLKIAGDIVIYGSTVSGARPEVFDAKGQIAAVKCTNLLR